MKRSLTFLTFMFFALSLAAVPAKRGVWRTLPLANGSTVRAELYGDERMHYYVGEDKAIYVQSGDVYRSISREDLSNRIATAQKTLLPEAPDGVRKAPRSLQKASEYTGDKKSIIILVQFSDMKFSMDDPQAFYTRVANEQNFTEGNFKGSLNDYFMEQSNNQFNLTFDVVGPYTLGTYATYGANTSSGGIDTQKAINMISQACASAASAGTDFTKYDWDGDGTVEEVYVLYAGKGEADGGDEDTMWPHKYQIPTTTYGGAKVSVYACSNEINGSGNVAGIGTICHEFSHCLGYPDMYDIDYSTNGQQYGMGSWDLMCSGSYNGSGYQPAGYTAYEKMVAGWVDPVDLSQVDKLTVSDMASIADGGNAYIMYNPGNSNEYYIIENRQQEGFNASLPAAGIMIHHIDYDYAIWNYYNCPNSIGDNNDHERITFFAADNNRSNYNEYGDTYPYNGNAVLNNGSSPSASVFNTNTSSNSKFMNINISNMAVDDDGVASFNFVNLNIGGNTGDDAFYESFDKCAGTGGNDGTFTPSGMTTSIATATFNPDNSGWSETNSYAYGGNMCARFGGASGGRLNPKAIPGVATTPTFTLNGSTTLTFKAAPYGTDGTTLTLSATGATLSQTTFTMVKDEWTDFTTTIEGSGDVTLTFTGAGRFFLDEVKVPQPATAGITTATLVQTPSTTQSAIYTIDGRYAGTDANSLPSGLYIRNGRKIVKR